MAGPAIDRPHVYESTTISGQANAVLGNKYNGYGDTFQIEQATFLLCGTPRSTDNGEYRGIKRKRAGPVTNNLDVAQSYKRHRSNNSHKDCRIAHIPKCTSQDKGHTAPNVQLLNSCYTYARRLLDAAAAPFSYAQLSEEESHYARSRNAPVIEEIHAAEEAGRTDTLRDPATGETSASVRRKRMLLDYALPAAILSILACRSVSLHTVSTALSDLRKDSLLPILTAVLGCWAAGLIQRASLQDAQALSEVKGDCATFEDVYKLRREVPLVYFADEGILRAFFAAHYRGSTASQFIADGQFSITSKSRSGQPISIAELCSGKTTPNMQVFMAILYRVKTLKCLECLNKLQQSRQGTYRCPYCRRVYRARYNQKVSSDYLNTASFLLPGWRTPDVVALQTGLGGLMNVDLGIRRKTGRRVRASKADSASRVHGMSTRKLRKSRKHYGDPAPEWMQHRSKYDEGYRTFNRMLNQQQQQQPQVRFAPIDRVIYQSHSKRYVGEAPSDFDYVARPDSIVVGAGEHFNQVKETHEAPAVSLPPIFSENHLASDLNHEPHIPYYRLQDGPSWFRHAIKPGTASWTNGVNELDRLTFSILDSSRAFTATAAYEQTQLGDALSSYPYYSHPYGYHQDQRHLGRGDLPRNFPNDNQLQRDDVADEMRSLLAMDAADDAQNATPEEFEHWWDPP